MRNLQSHKRFLFVGNHLCLDFVNTEMIVRGQETDLLGDVSDLMDWLVQARVLSAQDAKEALRSCGEADRRRLMSDAKDFRATLRRMAERMAAGKRVLPESVEAINRLFSLRPGYPQIARVEGHFERRFHSQGENTNGLLTPLAEAAGELLCSGDPALVKKCRNNACILYFYDTTKNHARQWCSMGLCGNRMKVAAHYKRTHASN